MEFEVLFQKSELFVQDISTAHVESFNNSLNVLHNNRISFGNDTYQMKTATAVSFWNDVYFYHFNIKYFYCNCDYKF